MEIIKYTSLITYYLLNVKNFLIWWAKSIVYCLIFFRQKPLNLLKAIINHGTNIICKWCAMIESINFGHSEKKNLVICWKISRRFSWLFSSDAPSIKTGLFKIIAKDYFFEWLIGDPSLHIYIFFIVHSFFSFLKLIIIRLVQIFQKNPVAEEFHWCIQIQN